MSTEEMKKSFAENFRRARGQRTQGECAALFKVNQSQIARWESGAGMPEAATIKKIADGFGIDPDQLLQPVQRSFGVSLGSGDELHLRITGKHEFALTLPLRNHDQLERAVLKAKESLDGILADSRAEVLARAEAQAVSSSQPSGVVEAASGAASRVADSLCEPTPQAGEPSGETPSPSPGASKQTTVKRSPARRAQESQ